MHEIEETSRSRGTGRAVGLCVRHETERAGRVEQAPRLGALRRDSRPRSGGHRIRARRNAAGRGTGRRLGVETPSRRDRWRGGPPLRRGRTADRPGRAAQRHRLDLPRGGGAARERFSRRSATSISRSPATMSGRLPSGWSGSATHASFRPCSSRRPSSRSSSRTDAPLPGRWRWVLWASIAVAVVSTISAALDPGRSTRRSNPIGAPRCARGHRRGAERRQRGVPRAGCLRRSLAALVVRFRTSHGIERQQMKWLAFAGVGTGQRVRDFLRPEPLVGDGRLLDVIFVTGFAALMLIPVAVAVAILRYRLYEIDRVISKTLVYGVAHGRARRGVRRRSCSRGRRCSRRSPAARTLRSPRRRSSSLRSSCRCAPACSGSSTGASTGAATTRSGRSRRSARGCARRSNSTTLAARPRVRSSTRRCSRRTCRSGCARRGLVSRSTAWLAWALAALAIALHVFGHVFVVLGIGIGTPGDEEANLGAVGFLVAFFAFPLVGAVIATRRPDNAIGWLFLAIGVVLGLDRSPRRATPTTRSLPSRAGCPRGEWAGLDGGVARPDVLRLPRARPAPLPGRTARLAALAARALGARRGRGLR